MAPPRQREQHTTAVSRQNQDERPTIHQAIVALEQVTETVRARLRERLIDPAAAPGAAKGALVGVTPAPAARLSAELLAQHQLAAHALAWLATELEASRQLAAWADRSGGALERHIADAYVGELTRSLRGGVDLGACETIALAELGLTEEDVGHTLGHRRVVEWASEVASGIRVASLAAEAREANTFGDLRAGVEDEEIVSAVREQFKRFADEEVRPVAPSVHRWDALIPLALVDKMSALGVFGLTVPHRYGGQGMSKVMMCVVTEELSRGSLGVGSLSTRAEIAGELILRSGTEAQRAAWLPRIAEGSVLPTAVFSEPDHGSDLAGARARAVRQDDGGYTFHGQKTWATHATRADLMTVLLRTDAGRPGYEGLSIFLAPKQRGREGADFPDPGIGGTEIRVIGYRGMKEYEVSFDGFRVGPEALLGGQEGQGFKQLMATLESARIQTAARGVGVAQAALEAAMKYAYERTQFGSPIASFPRVARKLGRMLGRVMAARQLTYFAARAKDSGRRCDLEAGMAKLLATRAAWETADACVQIHGGNGYAEEYEASRLLLDARVLSLFEGTSEIQAEVVARRLLEA
jgi:(2S)-methylsuccinyl-CoA dehydrogenase